MPDAPLGRRWLRIGSVRVGHCFDEIPDSTVREIMRHIKSYRVILVLLAFSSIVVFLSLITPLDIVGIYCTDQLFSEKCLCVENPLARPETRHAGRVHAYLEQPNVKCVMTIKPQGRLGNLMGEYATLYALSRLNGRPAFINAEMAKQLRDYFNLSIPVLETSIEARLPWTTHKLKDWMVPDYRNFTGQFVKLKGYPCSWTFYHHLRREIAREFMFLSPIMEKVTWYLRKVRNDRPSVTYIGVHIRRGDYVKLMKKTYNGVLADADYLAEAMNRFRLRFKDALFIICSDDLEWARKNTDNSRNDVVYGWDGEASSPGHDMALLSSCNHSIMTIGTFGYWSSYLAGGQTIYLNNFTRPGSEFLEVFHYDDAFLPEWEGIPANLNVDIEYADASGRTMPSILLLVVAYFGTQLLLRS